jgi:hypothetical protein
MGPRRGWGWRVCDLVRPSRIRAWSTTPSTTSTSRRVNGHQRSGRGVSTKQRRALGNVEQPRLFWLYDGGGGKLQSESDRVAF